MREVTFSNNMGPRWTKVLINKETVGYIHKEDIYFEATEDQPIFEIEDLELILAEMKKL